MAKYNRHATNYGKKLLAVMLVFIVFVGVAMRFWTKEASAAWFDDNWAYRQSVVVTNNSSQADYQVQVTLDTRTLINAGKMKSTCDDVRFTDYGGKVLKYWTEYCSNTANVNSSFWVTVPSLVAGTATLLVYYGNPSAPTYSTYSSYPTGLNIGTGKDGAITISSDTDINTTDSISGRTCTDAGIAFDGDAPIYTTTDTIAAGDSTIDLATSPDSSCLAVGDEVLIINMQGTTTSNSSVGLYETARVTTISTNVITLNHPMVNAYDGSTQKIVVQRVPNYTSVTVSTAGTDFTPSDWDGTRGGVMMFRASGTVSIAASTTINANGKGYRGGAGGTDTAANETDGGVNGESYDGSGHATVGRGGSNSTSCGTATVTNGQGCRGGGNGAVGPLASPNNGAARGGGGGGGHGGDSSSSFGNAGAGAGGGYAGGGGGGGGNVGSSGTAGAGGTGGSTGTAAGGGGGACNGAITTPGNGGNAGSGGTTGNCATSNGTGGQVGSGATSGSGGGGSNNGAHSGAGGGGGGMYGTAALTTLFLGSGGGGGGRAHPTAGSVAGTDGSDAGGIVLIGATTVTVTGAIQSNGVAGVANGTTGGGSGGGGAGGSVRVDAGTATLGSSIVTATGGAASSAGTRISGGGAGGVGRVATYYSSSSGTTSPTANTTTLPISGTAATEEKAPGAILNWKFDDLSGTTAQDASNSNLDGTLNNTPVWRSEGCISNGCLFFGGTTNQNVSKSDDSKLDFAASESFTVSAWVRRNGASSANNFILTKAQAGYTGYKLYQDASGDYCFDVRDGTNTDSACTSAVEYDDNKWHLVQGVKIGTTSVTLYVDGKQVAQDSSVGATNTLANTGTFYAGVDLDGTSNEWLGFIDEVKVYPYARSSAQVAADYISVTSEGGNVLGSNSQDFLTDGLAGYWKMDEGSANTCSGGSNDSCDSSGSGIDGAWNGNATSGAGKYSNSVALDGTSDHVLIGDQLDMADSDAFTLSAWVYRTAVSQDGEIVSKATSSASDGYRLVQYSSGNGGNTCLNVQDNSGNRYETCTADNTTVSLNGWVHVVAVFDNKGKEGSSIYLNGIDAESSNYEVGNPGILGNTSNSVTLCLGTEGAAGGVCGSSREFAGRIDDVRIYRRGLSSAEVQSLYNFAPGPVGYWNMEERMGVTTYDISGNSNTGTLNSSTSWVSGKVGSALLFNGSSDYVSITDSTSLSPTNAITISAWIKPTTASITGNHEIVQKSGSYGMKLVSGKFRGYRWGGVEAHDSTTTIPADIWSFVTMTYDGSTHYTYVNGVLESSEADSGSIPDTANDVNIANGSAGYFGGAVDGVKIYNYARNAKQIIEDMNGSHPAGGSPIGSQVAYWKLNEGYGTTANDSVSQNGFENLTLSSASWTNLGKFGKGWNGTGSIWLSIADDNDLDFASSEDFSLSMWVKSDSASNPGANQFLIAKQTATNNPGYRIYFNTSGQIVCDIDDDTASYPEDSATTTAAADYYDTAWHHVVCSRNIVTDHLDLFVDGKLAAQDTDLSATGSLSNSTTLYVGDDDGDSTNSFAGDIDEVKIYRSALTDSEIKIDMNQNAAQVFGALSTVGNTPVGSSSASAEYCVPGDNASCSGPVGEWKFEEKTGTTGYDTSGNGNDVTLTNSPIYTNSKNGSAIRFAGSNQHLTRADDSDFDFGASTSFTLEAWIKHGAASASETILVKHNEAGYKLNMESDGDITCGLDYDSTYSPQDSVTSTAATYDDNKWHHISCVKLGTNTSLTLYIDGKSVGTPDTAMSGATLVNSDPLYIGIDSDGTSNDWIGDIDQVRIYNYARTNRQVAWSYNQGKPVAYWKMDECAGATVYDASGLGNTATVTVGGSGTQTSIGTCSASAASTRYNGAVGKFNSSLSFDGTDDYAATSSSVDLSTTKNATVSFWLYWNAYASDDDIVMESSTNSNNPNNGAFYIDPNNSTSSTVGLNLHIDNANNTSTFPRPSAAAWHHWVVIMDTSVGSSINPITAVYIDGISQPISNESISGCTGGLCFMGDYVIYMMSRAGASLFGTGRLDDVQIYNYHLTPTQIKTLYNGRSSVRFGPVTGTP